MLRLFETNGLYALGPLYDLEEKEENEQMVNEEDEQGNILVYPAWSKKNAPKDKQNKWEVPIYM
ncbi:MAG: hypothetical protein PHD17_02925 [Methanothrix soehngenii]|jgi:hypothetical protein|uniref:hypothetical protein n=1 Tax=Methanothrix soehngenii TaxID=2223 RepID=UPI0023F1465C|nr:hypothetical protein [Methanothrix soehngenii]MCK9587208.1 hypothetical protein [Methanothrix soehngenii]MDD3552853.1 hypothetical protein [Methanothrix soehngenii]MDD3973624.1 hypothetical protein [Methanothrix soehngenii]MDD5257767.1 hypothetical protein [Methanothrix soehngenii]MDD5734457.1 hypothetical protein [Methanothrix soehngenii]